MKQPSAKKRFWTAVVWVISSALMLDVAVSKVIDLRAAGQHVSVWRILQAGFWTVLFPFFVWQTWDSWKSWRSELAESE